MVEDGRKYKAVSPSTVFGCAGCCTPGSRRGFSAKSAARLVTNDVDSTALAYLGHFTFVLVVVRTDCKIICPCNNYHVPMMFCKKHDVAEAA